MSDDDDTEESADHGEALKDALRDAKFYKEMYEREQKKTEMLYELKAAHEKIINEWIRKV